jgi:steroid delta-isomerase-like uncharacterized protein
MASSNIETYREGHQAFNRRDFDSMVKHYADRISWTDRAQGQTFRTPQEFKDNFLTGWVQAFPDCRVTDPQYIDGGRTVFAVFTATGTHSGPLGPLQATGKKISVPLCEMWHFDANGKVVGGDLYYDQVTLLSQLGLMPELVPA